MYSQFNTKEMSGRVYSQRRGVTLFIVLALMTMFALLVVTFMVITTQARRQAEHMAKALTEVPAGGGDGGHASVSSNFDTAIERLLIGDKLESVIAPHSILENLYGHPDWGSNTNLKGTITNNPAESDGYIEITNSLNFDDIAGYTEQDLTGNIITITKSPNKQLEGKSTFIIGTNSAGTGFNIAPFSGVTLDSGGELANSDFIINSPAFSGTGPGFNDTAGAGNAALEQRDIPTTGKPYALRPNILAPDGSTQTYKQYLQDNLVLMNPDYTAPDYLNMFLAWNDVQLVSGNWTIDNIIPSFHRPQLVRYWDTTDTDELRKIVLRPLPTDHPNFTGSNPVADSSLTGFNLFTFLTEGPWDVDNDGDGIADGIWIDAGLGTTTIDGQLCKRLVSYYVLDMDGRLNVNVHGNTEHDTDFDTVNDPMGGNTGGLLLRGSGSGPAGVRLDLGLDEIGSASFQNLLKGTGTDTDHIGRYGTDGKPGQQGSTAYKYLMGVNPDAYGGSGVGGNVPDWWGNIEMTFDPLGNRYFGTGLTLDGLFDFNPYLMNPYLSTGSGDESPFNPNDLQYLLRSVGDIDYTTLPKRLRNLLGETTFPPTTLSEYRWFLGTRSSDIPVFSRFGGVTSSGVSSGLYNYIYTKIYSGDAANANALYALLPEEIRRGEKINLNRLTLRDDWTTSDTTLLEAKAKFAQEIFYLLAVLCHAQIEGATPYTEGSLTKSDMYTRLAQWSVNFVDFIDPDATMTPFIFETTPFATTTPYDITTTDFAKIVDGTLTTTDLATPKRMIWGMEKPEIAITETFAVHNRRTSDSVITGESSDVCDDTNCGNKKGQTPGDGCIKESDHDDDFDQVKIPQGALFIELYRQGNDNRNYPAGDLVDSSTKEIDLAKTVADTTDPTKYDYVWRLVIGQNTGADVNGTTTNTNDMLSQSQTNSLYSFQTRQWKVTTHEDDPTFCDTTVVPDRIIWFGVNLPDASKVPADIGDYSYLAASGNTKLLADKYVVLQPDDTSGTDMHSLLTDSQIPTISASNKIVCNDLNVSIPFGGYSGKPYNPATGVLTTPEDKPFDQDELYADGTISCYRTICLQRLADPTRSHHPITNPYITVDWNMIDLHVINNEGSAEIEEKIPTKIAKGTLIKNGGKLVSRQWGIDTIDDQTLQNLWSRSVSSTSPNNPPNTNASTFGSKNTSKNLVHFPWHDAPFANSYELMIVPASTSGRFGFEFYDNGGAWATSTTPSLGTSGMRFASLVNSTTGVSPYLNFFDGDLNLSRLFDYVRVPSKFGGTIRGWYTDNGISKPIYEMREPGKINLNTAIAPAWEALIGTDYTPPSPPDPAKGRANWHSYTDTYGLYNLRNRTSNDYPSEFIPFRSPQAVNLVPPLKDTSTNGWVQDPANTTLLRKDVTGTNQLLEPETDADNPYTLLENYMRLSDMTTTRSNVFAVWMTIGYFGVTPVAVSPIYPDGYQLGAERGLGNGTVKRHRAFYLIDRSTPVGFRRGEVYRQENGDPHYKPVIIGSKILE